MTRMNLMEGFLLAFCLAAAGGVGFHLLTLVVTGPVALKLVFGLAALTYSLVSLWRTSPRTGLLTATAAWLTITLGVVFLTDNHYVFIISQALLIWLCRCLSERESFLCSIADLGLTTVAVLAGFWAALNTGSMFLALWSFFLLQALHPLIPDSLVKHPGSPSEKAPFNHSHLDKARFDKAPFEKAQRVAETALRQLSNQ